MSNAETKYLDLSGLSRYLQKTKEYINDNCLIKDENIDIDGQIQFSEELDSYQGMVIGKGHLKIGTLLTIGSDNKLDFGKDPALGSYTYIESTHISNEGVNIGSMRIPTGSLGNYIYMDYMGLRLGSSGLTMNYPVIKYTGTSYTVAMNQYYFASSGELKSKSLYCGELNCEAGTCKTLNCETLNCNKSITINNLMKSHSAEIGAAEIGSIIVGSTNIYSANAQSIIDMAPSLKLRSDINGKFASMCLKGENSSQRYVCDIDQHEIIFSQTDAYWNPISNNSFSLDGLKYPLSIKYRDASNTEKEFEYKGGAPSESNNQNILDLRDLSAPNIEGITHITYNELKVLRDNGELSPGTKYRITDYETIINGYNTAGHNFDIVVEALDNHILSVDAKAMHRPTKYIEGDLVDKYVSYGSDFWYIFDGWKEWSYNDMPEELKQTVSPDIVAKRQIYNNGVTLPAGRLKIKMAARKHRGTTYNSDLKYSIICLGVDLCPYNNLDVNDPNTWSNHIVSSDYHKKTYTYDPDHNTVEMADYEYILTVPEAGKYQLCIIVDDSEDILMNASNPRRSELGVYGDLFELTIEDNSYFNDTPIENWNLKYTIDNDSSRFGWANTTSGKGVIYYMKDENNNVGYYDFKNVKYGDYYTFDYLVNGTHYDGSTKYGKYCHHNIITRDTNQNKLPGLPKIYFKNTSATAECYYNIFDNDVWDMTFGSGCYKNSFGTGSEGNHFGDDCKFNIFKSNCKNNNLGHNCESNMFWDGCSSNILGDECNDNCFGNYCSSNVLSYTCCGNKLSSYCTGNKFGPQCKCNIFNDYCKNNILGCNDAWEYDSSVGGCTSNTFGYSCVKNCLKEKCLYNTFGDRFGIKEALSSSIPAEELGNKLGANSISNKFGVSCYSNEFGNNCSYNNIGDYCYLNTFGNYCQSNTMGVYCYSNTMGSYVLRCEIGKKVANCLISDGSDNPATGVQCITIKSNCNNVKIWSDDDPTLNNAGVPTSNICYVEVGPGISGSFEISRNLEYITSIEKNSRGEIRCFCKAD